MRFRSFERCVVITDAKAFSWHRIKCKRSIHDDAGDEKEKDLSSFDLFCFIRCMILIHVTRKLSCG